MSAGAALDALPTRRKPLRETIKTNLQPVTAVPAMPPALQEPQRRPRREYIPTPRWQDEVLPEFLVSPRKPTE